MKIERKHRKDKWGRRQRRHMRVRSRVSGTADRPRIMVRKTLKHLYAMVIDDSNPKGAATILAVTTAKADRDIKKSYSNIENATALGKELGEKLQEKGIKSAVFDRGGFRYHGCVKAIADGAREAGVKM